MYNIVVEQESYSRMKLEPTSIRRDWMDESSDKHAYRCYPVTQANAIGWNISCIDDVSFIWNGINHQNWPIYNMLCLENVKILKGKNFCHTRRGQGSLSFNTGLIFKADKNFSLFTINPVNYFNEDFETMSSLVSTSFPNLRFPLAIKARSANKEILIKAGTPLATIIPISLSELNNSSIEIIEYKDIDNKREKEEKDYNDAAQKINESEKYTNWYRDAVNEKGETIGSHEVKNLKLKVIDNLKK